MDSFVMPGATTDTVKATDFLRRAKGTTTVRTLWEAIFMVRSSMVNGSNNHT
jgi:hypothetical protein